MSNLWQSMTKPPYRRLPWLVWAYIVLSTAVIAKGGVFTGHLLGFDDQVRMVQVLDWINGHGWYDRTIMRANLPEGFTSIWSRIVDIPIALVVVLAQQFVPQKVAALIAATVIPLVEVAILFVAAPYFVRPLVGKRKRRLIVLFLLFSSLLDIKYFSASGFVVGQVSHHPWYVILNLTMFGAAARLAMGSANLSPVLMIGGSIALLTAVGIEGYPMIAGAAAILALVAWAGCRPAVAARGGNGILCGAIGSLLLLPMHQPPERLFTISFAEPSMLGVILVAAAGLFLKSEQIVLQRWGKDKRVSALILCLMAALTGGALIYFFPDMLNGGAAGLSPNERKMALHEHFEAKSLYGVSGNLLTFVNLAMPLAVGLAAAVFALRRSKGRRRVVYFCYFGFAVLGTGMTSLYSRYYHHAMTTASAWLLWAWEYIKTRLRKNRHYSLNALGVFLALGPMWVVLVPAVENNLPVSASVVFFPASLQAVTDPCDSLSMANYINARYGKTVLVDVPYWHSAQFLYQLDGSIDFLANYPSHDKFIDNYNFFGTRFPEEARAIALRHNFDLVVACLNPFLYYPALPQDQQTLIARLQGGHQPAWLKRVNTGGLTTSFALYEVDKEALKQAGPP